MVALNEKLLGVGALLMGSWGRRGWRCRAAQNAAPEVLASLRPTIFVPMAKEKDPQYAEVVARKV